MFPFISPRIPPNRVSYSSSWPSRWLVPAKGSLILRLARQALLILFFFAISALCLSSVLAKAPTPIEVETFLALDQWPVVAGLATFLVQALLIIWLLLTRARRREAEVESRRLALLADSERVRLNEVVSHVPGIVWEAQIDPVTNEVRTTFISDYAEQIVGYTVAECVSSPSFALGLVHEADRERVAREAAAVFSGTPTLLQ